jgi:hypothetical protein
VKNWGRPVQQQGLQSLVELSCEVYTKRLFVSPLIPTPDYSRLEKTVFSHPRIRSLTALVAGAGALGNEVVRILGLLGVAKVLVVDPDVVEASNLPRSFFFWGEEAVGKAKVSGLVEALTPHFPATQWVGLECEIADVGFGRIAESDILFSCVDSDLARLEIAYISTKLNISVIDAGLGSKNYSHGRISYFPGAKGACYGCMLSPGKRRELLQYWQATVRPCGAAGLLDEREFPSTPTMASAVAAMQVEFGLRSFFGERPATFGEPPSTAIESRSWEVRLHPQASMTEFWSPVSESCPFHDWGEQRMFRSPDPEVTIQELLAGANADDLLLDWPICTKAECLSCQHEWSPMLRLARMRLGARCPVCGSGNVLEVETTRSVGRDSPFVHFRPSALGLPLDHLYTFGSRSGKP